MEEYCQNPLCENEAGKDVPVSVNRASDERRSLCAVCEEAYSWGVQHGRMTMTKKTVWIVAVTHRGDTVHAQVVESKLDAVKALAEYLRAHEDYAGPDELPGICNWMAQHDEHLGADIFAASLELS